MKELLLKGNNIILDRYSASGVAYSAAKGMDFNWCKTHETGLIKPDITFFLKIDFN